ncbi:MAG: hypothetical protein ACRDGT_09645 [Candidatus Limnocylindria bacterium]
MASDRPTFRWNVLAFLAISALVVVVTVVLLVLLDPRSQEWWGDRFSELGTFVRGLADALLPQR